MKQVKINDLLLVKINSELVTAKVTRIIAIYPTKGICDLVQHTAEVDSAHINTIKDGLASIQVNEDDWVTYTCIIQHARQPSLIRFLFDRFCRFMENPFPFA